MGKRTQPRFGPVVGDGNGYCGPAALSILTGREVTECSKWLRWVASYEGIEKRAIKGVPRRHVIEALHRYGGLRATAVPVNPEPTGIPGKWRMPTLRRWRGKHRAPGTYLVQVTGHFVVVRGRRLLDNTTDEPVLIREHRSTRARVRHVYLIQVKGGA